MNFSKKIKIGNFEISEANRTFVIAEAGVNHNGDMDAAKGLVRHAAEAGADAVKFQFFKTEHLILRGVKKAPYQLHKTDQKESQFDMLKKLELTLDQCRELQDYCKQCGIIFLTTPFDEHTLSQLDSLDLPAYKISSTDITNLPFLKKAAQKQKPILLSTGMADLSDVKKALDVIFPINPDIILLQCTANYPISDNEVNLRVIQTYSKAFDILVGYSDHSSGIGAAPYAVACGAKVIEKHFTIDKSLTGPDQEASLNPQELQELVRAIRKTEKYLGSEKKELTTREVHTRASLQKCLVASRVIKKGEILDEDNMVAKRTGGVGISPVKFNVVKGEKSHRGYQKDEIIEERT